MIATLRSASLRTLRWVIPAAVCLQAVPALAGRMRIVRLREAKAERARGAQAGRGLDAVDCAAADCDKLSAVYDENGNLIGLTVPGAVTADGLSVDRSRLIRRARDFHAKGAQDFCIGCDDHGGGGDKPFDDGLDPRPAPPPDDTPDPFGPSGSDGIRHIKRLALRRARELRAAGALRTRAPRGRDAQPIDVADVPCDADCDQLSVLATPDNQIIGVVPDGAITADGKSFDARRVALSRGDKPVVAPDPNSTIQNSYVGIDAIVHPEKYIDSHLEPDPPPATDSSASTDGASKSAKREIAPGVQDGRFFALVIGINAYQKINKLENAAADAASVAELLQQAYGFQTVLIQDQQATRDNIVRAINEMRKKLTENDNLLIYYSGHGEFNKDTGTSYWLPVDSDYDDTTKWLDARTVADQLQLLSARHVLIVADSCFSGTISRSATTDLSAGTTRANYLRKLHEKTSRVLIASGGNEPVADGGAKGHSLFAAVFMKALREPFDKVFTAEELMSRHLKEAVAGRMDQTPEYKVIRNSGHDGGDFIFVKTGDAAPDRNRVARSSGGAAREARAEAGPLRGLRLLPARAAIARGRQRKLRAADAGDIDLDKICADDDCSDMIAVYVSDDLAGVVPIEAVSKDGASIDRKRLVTRAADLPKRGARGRSRDLYGGNDPGCSYGLCDSDKVEAYHDALWADTDPNNGVNTDTSASLFQMVSDKYQALDSEQGLSDSGGDRGVVRLSVRRARQLAAARKIRKRQAAPEGDDALDVAALDCGAIACDDLSVIADAGGNVLGVVSNGAFARDDSGFDRSRLVSRKADLSRLARTAKAGDQGARLRIRLASRAKDLVKARKLRATRATRDVGDSDALALDDVTCDDPSCDSLLVLHDAQAAFAGLLDSVAVAKDGLSYDASQVITRKRQLAARRSRGAKTRGNYACNLPGSDYGICNYDKIATYNNSLVGEDSPDFSIYPDANASIFSQVSDKYEQLAPGMSDDRSLKRARLRKAREAAPASAPADAPDSADWPVDPAALSCDEFDCDALSVIYAPGGDVLGVAPDGAFTVDDKKIDARRIVRKRGGLARLRKAARQVAATRSEVTPRRGPTTAVARSTSRRARDAEPADVVQLLWAGQFADAQSATPMAGTPPGVMASLRTFATAGKLRDAGNYGAARSYFDKASKISPDVERIARFWRCSMYRLENRNAQADDCFKTEGIDESEATRHK